MFVGANTILFFRLISVYTSEMCVAFNNRSCEDIRKERTMNNKKMMIDGLGVRKKERKKERKKDRKKERKKERKKKA